MRDVTEAMEIYDSLTDEQKKIALAFLWEQFYESCSGIQDAV